LGRPAPVAGADHLRRDRRLGLPRALPALQGAAAALICPPDKGGGEPQASGGFSLIFLSEATQVATRTSSIGVRIELSEAFRGRVYGGNSFGYAGSRHARIVRAGFGCLGEEGQSRSDAHGARCRRLVQRPCG